jgi:hypothetical protein
MDNQGIKKLDILPAPEKLDGKRASTVLEGALRYYERVAQMAEAVAFLGIQSGSSSITPSYHKGVIKHWHKARDILMSIRPGKESDPLPKMDHLIPTPEQLAFEDELERNAQIQSGVHPSLVVKKTSMLSTIDSLLIPQLAVWTKSSRRIFSVAREAFEKFVEADYSAFSWDDVTFPFGSFMIEFPPGVQTPLPPAGAVNITGMLITNLSEEGGDGKSIECRLFFSDPATQGSDIPPGNTTKEQDIAAERFIKKPKSRELLEAFANEARKGPNKDGLPITPFGMPFKINLSKPITDDTTGMAVCNKVIAGLLLYLSFAEDKESANSQAAEEHTVKDPRGQEFERVVPDAREPHPRRPTPQNLIRDKAAVLSVTGLHSFEPSAGRFQITDKTGRKLSVHARRSHWRRPKKLPDAPKSIRVRATWVNVAENLPENVLPGGATTRVR